jgi:hypothetical protein
MEGSGSGSIQINCGSRRPKNIRIPQIRIRILNTVFSILCSYNVGDKSRIVNTFSKLTYSIVTCLAIVVISIYFVFLIIVCCFIAGISIPLFE